MLAILKVRIGNTRDEELKNAAAEQLKITAREKLAAICDCKEASGREFIDRLSLN